VAASRPVRSPFALTVDVWRALFLREALYRVSQDRMAWAWLLLEPIAHVALLIWAFTSFRHLVIAGADTAVFVTLGVLGFFVPRNILLRSVDAISQNAPLFAYRQVKPVDTVLVRAALEVALELCIFLVIFAGLALLGHEVVPADPLRAAEALGVLWLLGGGLGLTASAAGKMIPETSRVMRVLVNPVYFLSAVFYPIMALPPVAREALLFNPFVHGIEALRAGFMPTYRVPPDIELAYPLAAALALIFLGLAMHVRFRAKLIEQ
jgi:capsular polysaccharide transport system permease protein